MTTRLDIRLSQDIIQSLVDRQAPLSAVEPDLQELSYMLDDLLQLHDLLDELDIPGEDPDTGTPLTLDLRVRLLATHQGFALERLADDQLSQLSFF